MVMRREERQFFFFFGGADESIFPLKQQCDGNLNLLSFKDERSGLVEHYRGREQRGVDIIELTLVSHGNDTYLNLMLGTDWMISSSHSLEKRLKRSPAISCRPSNL